MRFVDFLKATVLLSASAATLLAVLTLLSNSLILRVGTSRVRIAQGWLDDAITIYRRLLVTDQASKYTSFYEPRYVLAISRLLDKTGIKAEARAE